MQTKHDYPTSVGVSAENGAGGALGTGKRKDAHRPHTGNVRNTVFPAPPAPPAPFLTNVNLTTLGCNSGLARPTRDSDVGAWFDASCWRGDVVVFKRDLFASWKQWAKNRALDPKTGAFLTFRLKRMGIQSWQSRMLGVGLKATQ